MGAGKFDKKSAQRIAKVVREQEQRAEVANWPRRRRRPAGGSGINLSKFYYGLKKQYYDEGAGSYKIDIADGYVVDNNKAWKKEDAQTVEMDTAGEVWVVCDYTWRTQGQTVHAVVGATPPAPDEPSLVFRTVLYHYTIVLGATPSIVLNNHNLGAITANKFGFYGVVQSTPGINGPTYNIAQANWESGVLGAMVGETTFSSTPEVNDVGPLKAGLIVWVSREIDDVTLTPRYSVEYALPHGTNDFDIVWYDKTDAMGGGAGKHYARNWRFSGDNT